MGKKNAQNGIPALWRISKKELLKATDMTTNVIDIKLNKATEPQLAEIFEGHPSLRYVHVTEDHTESTYALLAIADGDKNQEAVQAILAEKIAELMLRQAGFEETVRRLEAMSQDPGRTVVWEEFDDK